MTAENFRTLALALPGAVESAHIKHPDFRAAGKIFASPGSPDHEHGMVKLTPEQQAAFIEKGPSVFAPCRGAWGLRGATNVHLPAVTKRGLQSALEAACGKLTAPATTKRRRGRDWPAEKSGLRWRHDSPLSSADVVRSCDGCGAGGCGNKAVSRADMEHPSR